MNGVARVLLCEVCGAAHVIGPALARVGGVDRVRSEAAGAAFTAAA